MEMEGEVCLCPGGIPGGDYEVAVVVRDEGDKVIEPGVGVDGDDGEVADAAWGIADEVGEGGEGRLVRLGERRGRY